MRLFGIGCTYWLPSGTSIDDKTEVTFQTNASPNAQAADRDDATSYNQVRVSWALRDSGSGPQACVAGSVFVIAMEAPGENIDLIQYRKPRICLKKRDGSLLWCHAYWGSNSPKTVRVPEACFLAAGVVAPPFALLNAMLSGTPMPGLIGLGARFEGHRREFQSVRRGVNPPTQATSRVLGLCRALPWLTSIMRGSPDALVHFSRIDAEA